MKDFMSPSEIAKICQVSPSSVIRWIHEEKLRASTTAGGHHRVQKSDLVDFLIHLKMPVPSNLVEQRTVLIVDDEAPLRTLIRSVIESTFPKVRVEEANEGFVAGWKANSLRPSLVILDIHLPGMNGIQVCELIRSIPALAETKILAISGAMKDRKEEVLQSGADDFLAKPFQINELKEKIALYLKLEEK